MQELSGQVAPVTTEAAVTGPSEEVRFFTAPKAVIKKSQLSITAFQLLTAAAFCLLLKLCSLFSPELFANIHLYLERLFRW